MTFAQARGVLLAHLKTKGWAVSEHLKVPHATSPDGRVRLWFKPQAVWVSVGSHTLANARSLWLDIRERLPETVEAVALARGEEAA